ncbi:MAG: hypothetical protein C4301_03405 [Thermus sp.]|uniref:AI-2E family transporter n=1 Tax=Thermus sp. TaxID=275 RepID=UPI003317A050
MRLSPFFYQAALFLLALWAATRLLELFLWVFLAFTLAAAVEPLVGGLAGRLGRPLAVLLAYALLLGAVFLVGVLTYPVLARQFAHLAGVLAHLPVHLEALADRPLETLLSGLASAGKAAGGVVFRLVGGVSEAVLALVLAVMVSLEPHLVARLAPYLPGAGWAEVLEATWRRMGYWARAQFFVAFSFALLFGTWLSLVKAPAPWALAVLGGVLEVVPLVGGAIIALLSAGVALSKGLVTAGLVLLGYGALALLEGKVLIPYIYSRHLGYHPAVVLLAIFVAGKLFGLLGVFLAVPGLILVDNLYRFWRQKA